MPIVGEPAVTGTARTASPIVSSPSTSEPVSEAWHRGRRVGPRAERSGRSGRETVLLHGSVIAGFVLLGVVLWWHVWVTGHPTTTITCQCGDPSQELWFLTWTPWAITHGHNPFVTNLIFAGRGGANMMVNTSWMLPSLVLAPITWLFGPIASFNVAATIAPAVSGWCFFLVVRKMTTFVPGQVLGGLLYGFSPFVLQNDPFGHLDFTLLFFAPLSALLLYDLLVSHDREPVHVGVLLGLVTVAEFFTSTEFLAMCVLMAIVAIVAASALAPRAAWAQRRAVAAAFATAGAVAAVCLAYPVWTILDGPRRIVGYPWANSPQLGTTPSAVVNAGQGVHTGSLFDRIGGYFGGVGPNAGPLHLPSGVFLGFVLVGFLLVSTLVWYHSRLAWTLAITTAVAWLFSFGTMLGTEASPPGLQVHPWWLPWRLFAHVPLVSDILPIRFAALVIFGAAMLLVISLDRWRTVAIDAFSSVGPVVGPVVGVFVTVVGLVSLAPIAMASAVPFTVASSPLPAWFRNSAGSIPSHAIVLVVPFAGQSSMGWQAQTGMRFALADGFAVVPGAGGRSEFVQPPSGAVGVLDRLSPAPGTFSTGPLPDSVDDVTMVRDALARWHVGVVAVIRQGADPVHSAAFFTAVFGRAPAYQHHAWVWHGSPSTTTITPVGTS